MLIMKKILGIFLVNIILLVFAVFIAEGTVWVCENLRMKACGEKYIGVWPIPFHPGIKTFNPDFDYYPNPQEGWGRATEGLNYKKPPIVVFGCSYVYGYLLDKNQTLTYKLAHKSKRPVYSRAFQGWGIQHMLYQVRQDKFYNHVKEPQYAVFVMMFDHFRRLYSINFLSGHLLNEEQNLRYKLKDGKLIQITNSNPFFNFIKRSYVINKFHQAYVNNVILKPKNYENYSKFALEHFIESKEEMQKHWKNTKYIVLYYNKFYNDDKFTKSLEEKGFQVISLPDLTNADLDDDKYKIKDGHPNESAWDLISDKLIKTLRL